MEWIGIFICFIGVILLIRKGCIDVLLNFNFNGGDRLFFICEMVWGLYWILGVKMMNYLWGIGVRGWWGLMGGIEVGMYGYLCGELY